jgi:hypothetical protein
VRAELVRIARDEQVGGSAIGLLARIEPETAASLAREAMSSGEKSRQQQALGVATGLDPGAAGSIVEEGLRSRDMSVLSQAMYAVYSVRTPGVEREVLSLVRDERVDEWTRKRAAHQIRSWGGPVAGQVGDELDALLGPVE